MGFGLNVIYSIVCHKLRIGRLKKAIREECKSLLGQIPQLIDIYNKSISNLNDDKILPGPAVRSISTVYHSNISEITPYLCVQDRNLLHVVFERLRVGDELLDSYASELSKTLKENFIENPIEFYINKLRDQIESYEVVKKLLLSYINRKPIDVFKINLSEGERGKLVYR